MTNGGAFPADVENLERDNSIEPINSARLSSTAMQEIQAGVILARRFRRSEEGAYQRVVKALERYKFADMAVYEYRRGKTTIEGASVYLAREVAKYWGNLRYGAVLTGDTEDVDGNLVVTGYGYCWDLESNVFQEEAFRVPKLVQREGGWRVADDRELREVVNKGAAIATRNCILRVIPWDMTQDFLAKANATLEANVKADPDATKKGIIEGFGKLNVPVAEIEEYLKHPLGRCTPKELVSLRNIYKAIANQEANWVDYYKPKAKSEGSINFDQLQPKPAAKPENAPNAAATATQAEPAATTEASTGPEPASIDPGASNAQNGGLFAGAAETGYDDQPAPRKRK